MIHFKSIFLPLTTFRLLSSQTQGNKLLGRMIGNSGWLFLENAVRMILAVTVGVWLSRYLGPEKFGAFSYASTLIGIFSILANLGLDSVVVRDLVKHPDIQEKILGSAFVLCLYGALLSLAGSIFFAHILMPNKNDIFLLSAILSCGLLFQPFQTIILWFRSHLLGKYIFLTKSISVIITSIITVILILYRANIYQIAFVRALELPLLALCLFIAINKVPGKIQIFCFNAKIAKNLLTSSYPLILSSILVILNMQIDKIMLGNMVNNISVGYYSAATKLTEMWYIVPIIIGVTVSPVLVHLKSTDEDQYFFRLKQIFTLLTWIGILACISITATSNYIIKFLYGTAYSSSSSILSVHIWSSIFVFHVSLRSHLFIIEMHTLYVSLFALITTSLNILLNYFLIPEHQGLGAAYASLLSWMFGVLIVPLLFNSSRKYPLIFLQSIFFVPSKILTIK